MKEVKELLDMYCMDENMILLPYIDELINSGEEKSEILNKIEEEIKRIIELSD